MDQLATLDQAVNYLYNSIPRGSMRKFPGQQGIDRTRQTLASLGNPQEQLKVIHLAGTSGKGSTATYTSRLLEGFGFKVGLHISPHLQDIRERCQINHQLIAPEKFIYYLNQLLPLFEEMKQTDLGEPTYFEALVVLAFYIFAQEKVDYAVMETGMGGTFDATNTVQNPDKLAIITRIGHDHMHTLGRTLAQIASQKAGIIQPGNTVFTIFQHPNAQAVVTDAATRQHARLFTIHRQQLIHPYIKNDQLQFGLRLNDRRLTALQLPTPALYQAQNAALAVAAVHYLTKRDDWRWDERTVRSTLSTFSFAGRMEIQQWHDRPLILDGAHNPQKMAAFLRSLAALYPGQTFDFLIAFKRGKDYNRMVKQLIPLAHSITVTGFLRDQTVGSHLAASPDNISQTIRQPGTLQVDVIPDSARALAHVKASATHPIVITGSLYLVGELRSLIASNPNT